MSILEKTVFSESNNRLSSGAGSGEPFEIGDRDTISITFDAGGGDYSMEMSNNGMTWIETVEQLTGTHLITNSAGFQILTGPAPVDCKCIPDPCGYIRFVTVTPGTDPEGLALSKRI